MPIQNREIYWVRKYIVGALRLGEGYKGEVVAKEYEISFWDDKNWLAVTHIY